MKNSNVGARRASFGWRVVTLGFAMVALYGCGGGLSCGGNSGCLSAYPFPQTQDEVPNGADFVDDGVRMRMTQDALDFLAANIRPLLAGALGSDPNNPDNIMITSTQPLGASGFQLAQGENETHPTEIYINAAILAATLEMEFVGDDAGEPEGIRIRAVDVPIGFDGRLFTDFGLGNAACDVFGSNGDYGGYPYVTGLTIEATIKPRVGNGAECDAAPPGAPPIQECLKIDVEVNDLQIGSFGAGALDLDQAPTCPPFNTCNGFDFNCSGANSDGLGPCSEDCSDSRVPTVDENGDLECIGVCAIEDVALDFISAIAGFLVDILQDFLPGVLESAIRSALEDVDGSPLAASGRLNLSTFAPGVLPASSLDLGFAVGPTVGAFDVNDPAAVNGAQGMDLIFKSGFEAAPSLVDDTPVPHPCVRHIEGNDFANLYGGFAFEAPDAEPLNGVYDGQVYHLGASLAKAAVNQMLFATYNTGALCIEASTDSIHALTGGAFPLNAAVIDTLTSGKLRQYAALEAPVLIALAPSQPPVITYGAGTDTEGHLLVDWPAVEISFYVLMNERFSRIFAVATDISLQLTVFNDPATGTLRIAVVDGPNIENFTENYNELMPGVAFTDILESLIGVAFDAALGDGLEFNFDVGPILSDALGGAPVFVEFRAIETTPPDAREFLNVYLGLTSTPPQPFTINTRNLRISDEPGVLRVDESVLGDALAPAGDTAAEPSGAHRLPLRQRIKTTGEVRIESDDMLWDAVPSSTGTIGGREYFARVDFGAWRGPLRPQADGVLVVRDPKLRLTGEHAITLRARIIGDPNSLTPVDEAETVRVWVDPEAPRVDIARVADQIVARGWDVGTRTEDLQWQWQLDDGAWSDPSSTSVRTVSELRGNRVAVRAVDGAGNVSKSAGLDLVVERKRLDEEGRGHAGQFGCTQSARGSVVDAVWLAGLTFGCAALLRRRRR